MGMSTSKQCISILMGYTVVVDFLFCFFSSFFFLGGGGGVICCKCQYLQSTVSSSVKECFITVSYY